MDRRGFAPHPTRAVTALDPHLRMLFAAANMQLPADAMGNGDMPGLTTCASGHGGFQPPNRCAKRTGKREGNRSGKSSFFPDRFPSLFLCPEASNFSQPHLTGGGCFLSPASNFANYGSRDEPRATACGGCLARGEINRNEQCPHEADLRRLRLRTLKPLAQVWGPYPAAACGGCRREKVQ